MPGWALAFGSKPGGAHQEHCQEADHRRPLEPQADLRLAKAAPRRAHHWLYGGGTQADPQLHRDPV